MKRFVYVLALVLVGVWVFPVAVFGEPNDNVIEPTVEQNNDDQNGRVEDQGQNDNNGNEQQNGSKECTEFIPYDERNPNLSPEEKQAIEQYRKYLKENFVCEEQGDHYQTWVSKDKKIVTSFWTSNPLDTLRFWTPEMLESAKPYINRNYDYIDAGKLIEKDIKPPGPPGKIEPSP